MAAVVAPDSGSQPSTSPSVRGKGHQNKRKLRGDAHFTDQNKLIPPQIKCTRHEFLVECSLKGSNPEQHAGVCEICSSLADPTQDEHDMDEFESADWNNLTETQLKELLLSSLDAILKSVVRKIASDGYEEEDATKAVLMSGICYGCNDVVPNILNTALSLLKNGLEVDSLKEPPFENLQLMEEQILEEMISVLREVRPFFSTGDAMWCLLICDMDMCRACGVEMDPFGALGNDGTSSVSSFPQAKPDPDSSTPASSGIPECDIALSNKLDLSPCLQGVLRSSTPSMVGIPNLPTRNPQSKTAHTTTTNPNTGKENLVSLSHHVMEVSQSHSPEEKLLSVRKVQGSRSKRESALRQKSIHFEKTYRAYASKGATRSGKFSGLGSLVLDNKCKSFLDSSGISFKSGTIKISKSIRVNAAQKDGSTSIAIRSGAPVSSTLTTLISKTGNGSSPSPVTSTEIYSPVSPKTSSCSSTVSNIRHSCTVDLAIYDKDIMPADKMSANWVPSDKKDDMVLQLLPRIQELKMQLQEWTEWARQKVMQAARRLSKDKAEIQALRQAKEEVARLQKEKQNLEQNTMKKLSEMESAISKADIQVAWAAGAKCGLEHQNAELRRELEAANLQATKSAASYQEVSRREMESLKNFQSWDKEKSLLQEEIVAEKDKLLELQKKLDQAMECQNQLEARFRREGVVEDEALRQAKSLAKEREQIEVNAKSKEDTTRLKADEHLQKHINDIWNLENQVRHLRLITGSSKIAALLWGTDDRKSLNAIDGSSQYSSMKLDLHESESGYLQREEECVMCLTEEKSIVFLPCAHQVVCTKCNELHEKQRMKDCPSCRTPIQHRISVRFPDS